MERNCNLNEITDGRFYDLNDMVKVGCGDCKDCYACCQGMGSSIVLDPYDVYRLTNDLDTTFEQLLQSNLELNVVEGFILPNLKMSGEKECCSYLNEEGRCSIHKSRPSICRIFPLGRIYENNTYQYILQVNECKKSNRTKVKLSKWIDTPNQQKNKEFITEWHYFKKSVMKAISANPEQAKGINMLLLNTFYVTPYNKNDDFYSQFKLRLSAVKQQIPFL